MTCLELPLLQESAMLLGTRKPKVSVCCPRSKMTAPHDVTRSSPVSQAPSVNTGTGGLSSLILMSLGIRSLAKLMIHCKAWRR